MKNLKPIPKLILALLLAVGIAYTYKQAAYYGWIPRPEVLKTVVPIKAELVQSSVLQHGDVKALPLPSTTRAFVTGGSAIRMEVWAWNAQMGCLYANGGEHTMSNSLMAQHGVELKFSRQDNSTQMQTDLLSLAQALSSGTDQAGVHFVGIMGDGAAAFLQGINPRLAKIGPEYTAEVVGSCGYSRGEDQFMGLAGWKANPQKARGALIAGVLRDGDWNIAMRWAQINDIPNNPDDTVYDPNALNWVSTDSYIEASQKYISNFCPELPLKGNRSKKQKVCVEGVVTWTPGDVMVAEKRGGLVTLLSTKTAIFQMPHTIIGIAKWDKEHADKVAGMLAAFGDGADQIRSNPDAFRRASEISAAVYKEESPEYWAKYYRGVSTKDVLGNPVDLGGSYASNLADSFQLFGLTGGPNIFKATYETWGNVDIQQYPTIMKEYPTADKIVNTAYLKMVLAQGLSTSREPSEAPSHYTPASITSIVGKRNYSINFKTGSADILPSSLPTLDQISNDLITSNTLVIVHGHTDNTGSAAGNLDLSDTRAISVKQYLMRAGKSAVPDSRIRTVPHGQDDPIADNTTEAGRAKNRRVEIVLGN